MKRILAFLLCLSMLFVMASCGGDDSSKEKETTAKADDAVVELEEDEENNLDNAEEKPLKDDVPEDEEDLEDEEDYDEEIVSDPIPEDLIGTWKGVMNFGDIVDALLEMYNLDKSELDLSFLDTFASCSLDMTITFNEDNTSTTAFGEENMKEFINGVLTLAVEIGTNPEFVALVNGITIEEATEQVEALGITKEQYAELLSSMITDETIQGINGTSTFYIIGNDITIVNEESESENYMIYEDGVLTLEDESGLLSIVFEKQ